MPATIPETNPVLLLEFSTQRKSAAVWMEGRRCAALTTDDAACDGHWPLLVRQVLANARVTADRLRTVAVGLGPGSYAGIRTALAVAQGICLPTALPLLGINSAAAWANAWLHAEGGTAATVIGDARRGYFWVGRFAAGARPFHDARDFALVKPEALPNAVDPQAVVLCPDAGRIGGRLQALLPANRIALDAPLPDADMLGQWLALHPEDACTRPLPIYLFPPVRTGG